jgi:hypothetical protein
MKKLLLILLLFTAQCEARTFGCFMGVLGAKTERSFEVDYLHYQVYSRSKHSTEFLPFAGCGISFDF